MTPAQVRRIIETRTDALEMAVLFGSSLDDPDTLEGVRIGPMPTEQVRDAVQAALDAGTYGDVARALAEITQAYAAHIGEVSAALMDAVAGEGRCTRNH